MEKNKALEMALGNIEKQFGKGAVMKMGERTGMEVATIPTGALALDLALGVGGPASRSGGRGLRSGVVRQVHSRHARGGRGPAQRRRSAPTSTPSTPWTRSTPPHIGVDVDELLISQPDTGEQALEIADILVRSGSIDVIVVDSVAALTPRGEIEGEMGDTHVGLQARLMSQALRKITGNLSKTGTICIFINQLREKIGV